VVIKHGPRSEKDRREKKILETNNLSWRLIKGVKRKNRRQNKKEPDIAMKKAYSAGRIFDEWRRREKKRKTCSRRGEK